jgi:MFS family permease
MADERRSLVAVSILFFVNGATAASWLPRLPEVRDRLGVTEAGLGLTLVGAGLGGVLMSVTSGHVVDRFGSRRVSVTTSIVLSALLPLVGLARVPFALFAVLVGLGSFDGLTDVAMNRQAIMVQDRLQAGNGAPAGRSGAEAGAHRDRHILTRVHGVWSLGAVVGSLISSRAATAGVSLLVQLAVTAVLLVAASLAAFRWLLPDPPARAHKPHAATLTTPLGEVIDTPPRSDHAVARSLLARFALVGLAVALAEGGPNDWASLMWVDHYDLSTGRAALGYVAFATGMVVGRFSGDAIVVRAGREPTRRGGAAVAAAGIVLATLAPGPWVSGVGLALAGFGVSQLFPLMFVAASAATAGRSIGMAAFSSGARLGFLVGPPVIGALAGLSTVAIAVLIVAGFAAVTVASTRV